MDEIKKNEEEEEDEEEEEKEEKETSHKCPKNILKILIFRRAQIHRREPRGDSEGKTHTALPRAISNQGLYAIPIQQKALYQWSQYTPAMLAEFWLPGKELSSAPFR